MAAHLAELPTALVVLLALFTALLGTALLLVIVHLIDRWCTAAGHPPREARRLVAKRQRNLDTILLGWMLLALATADHILLRVVFAIAAALMIRELIDEPRPSD